MWKRGKQWCYGSAIALGVGLFGLVSGAQSATIAVSSDGSGDFTSVSEALLAAEDGDEVLIARGVYDESEPGLATPAAGVESVGYRLSSNDKNAGGAVVTCGLQ